VRPIRRRSAAILGVNPVGHLLAPSGVLATLPSANRQTLTGREFFPRLISAPFRQGLTVVFLVAAGLSVLAALASLLRGGHDSAPAASARPPADARS
jgi:hypothetical protein